MTQRSRFIGKFFDPDDVGIAGRVDPRSGVGELAARRSVGIDVEDAPC